jgi:hypothetical protein
MYRDKYGPFNQTVRTDAALARAIVAMRGGAVGDYMPWPKQPEPEASLDDLMLIFKTAAVTNRRKKNGR